MKGNQDVNSQDRLSSKHDSKDKSSIKGDVEGMEAEGLDGILIDDNSSVLENEIMDLEKRNIELNEKLVDANDKYVRLFAEFDNFRRRNASEKAEIIKNGSEKIIKVLLPIVDDFERALKAMDNDENIPTLRQGVELIYHKLISTLEKEGLKAIDQTGVPFDTDIHEAITNFPVEDESLKGKVVEIIEKGYTLNDKVIRFAKVIIGC